VLLSAAVLQPSMPVVKLLQSGDEILAVDDIYGGAFRLFTNVYEKFGITVNYVDTSDVEKVFNAITKIQG
jgi:cystathionine beta-lyase